MKKFSLMLATALIIAAPGAVHAKKTPKLSSLEVQQMQSRELETPKGIAFSAIMSVLQDDGYRIGSADKETGLITGIASTESKTTFVPFVGFGKKKRTPIVSAYVEELSPKISRIRLNFVMGKADANRFGSDAGEKPILDPAVYQDAFEKIQKAVFVRQAMDVPAGD